VDDIYDFGLYLLNGVLLGYGRTLHNFPPMPIFQQDWDNIIGDENPYIIEQTSYNIDHERLIYKQQEALLNNNQKFAYNAVVQSALDKSGEMFFLSGPGGTGKTFVYTTICSQLQSLGHIVLCVASLGIAALLLPGGHTAHLMFKIPVKGLHEHSMCAISKRGHHADMLRKTCLIIWDEAGNQNQFAMEAVDQTLQDICNTDRAFGRITTVFGGDFWQTLPVVPQGTCKDSVGQCLNSSPLWSHVQVLYLHQNMRLLRGHNATIYAQFLLDVGWGTAGDSIQLPESMKTDSIHSLIGSIYTGISTSHKLPPADYFLNWSILSACNGDVDSINQHVLDMHPGPEEVFYSANSGEQEANGDQNPAQIYPVEFL
jgi:hypothetical protein